MHTTTGQFHTTGAQQLQPPWRPKRQLGASAEPLTASNNTMLYILIPPEGAKDPTNYTPRTAAGELAQ
jgi:hypothetical protein